MFLMLCVVFAAAGPEVPGVCDVFLMGPTMADGAVPHMLPSAPDGGGGFVLGGWCSTLNFMSPLFASIAGQMCNQGAQKGIAHVPEGLMAGQASSRAQTEGISKIWEKTQLLQLLHIRAGTILRCRTRSVRAFPAATTGMAAVNRAGGARCFCLRFCDCRAPG